MIFPKQSINTKAKGDKPWSKSSISFLVKNGIYDPVRLLERYEGRHKKKSSAGMFSGSLLDDMILSPAVYAKKYQEVEFKYPGSDNQKAFVALLRHLTLEELKDEDLINAAHKASYKTTSKPKALKEFLIWEDLVKWHIANPGIIPVSKWDIIKANAQRRSIDAHPMASYYLGHFDPKTFDVFDQMKLEGKLEGIPLIGYADRVVVDHSKKIVTVIDLKTVYSADKFSQQYCDYSYHLQLSIYIDLLKSKPEYAGYEFKGVFVCVENQKTSGRYRTFIPREPSTKEFIELGRSGGTVQLPAGSAILQGYKQIMREINYQQDEGTWELAEEESNTDGEISLGMYIVTE
jgi:hypothetical protein